MSTIYTHPADCICPFCAKQFPTTQIAARHVDRCPVRFQHAGVAVQQLHEQLERLSAKHGKLPEREATS